MHQGGDNVCQGGDKVHQGGDNVCQGGDKVHQGGDNTCQGGDNQHHAIDNPQNWPSLHTNSSFPNYCLTMRNVISRMTISENDYHY
ncbi:hypothetical protein [Sporosarcina limicola]|uniref:Uncharacterized protein n=1 Tax=Sporosarcina limicola TaxID=34101 RepID=A0A927RF74_9BACL|nr:hypothetical protein [Sporosarcina limicola]MBE1555257.1 hypothetical protein [Sporosarcina limicola]